MTQEWRRDGLIVNGNKITEMIVVGPDGSHPTLFVEAECCTKADRQWFVAQITEIIKKMNGGVYR